MRSGSAHCDSGLLHQRHRSGQDLRKTMVRIPGPSCTLKRWMSKTMPVALALASVLGAASSALTSVLGATNDFILYFLVKFDEVCTVTCHSDHEAAELFRVLLRLAQGLA